MDRLEELEDAYGRLVQKVEGFNNPAFSSLCQTVWENTYRNSLELNIILSTDSQRAFLESYSDANNDLRRLVNSYVRRLNRED